MTPEQARATIAGYLTGGRRVAPAELREACEIARADESYSSFLLEELGVSVDWWSPCESVRDHLAELADMSPNERESEFPDLAEHLASCRSCRSALEELAGDRAAGASVEGMLAAARALRDQARYDEALRVIGEVASLYPADPRVLLNEVPIIKDLGRYSEALAKIEVVLEHNAEEVDALNEKGSILLALHQPGEAVTWFEKAAHCNPDRSESWSNLGWALADVNRLDEALTSFERALALNAESYPAWLGHSQALLRSGRVEEAAQALRRGLELEPTSRRELTAYAGLLRHYAALAQDAGAVGPARDARMKAVRISGSLGEG